MSSRIRTLVVLACVGAVSAAPARSLQDDPSQARLPARPLQVGGVVVHDGAGGPVPGALVLLNGARSVRTDPSGAFVFAGVRPGRHEIYAVTDDCAVAHGTFEMGTIGDAMLRLVVVRPEQGWTPPTGAVVETLPSRELRRRRERSVMEVLEAFSPDLFGPRPEASAEDDARAEAPRRPRSVLVLDGVRVGRNAGALLRTMTVREIARLDVVRLAPSEGRPRGAPDAVVRVTTVEAAEAAGPCLPEGVSRR